MAKKRMGRFYAWMCMVIMLLSAIVPPDIAYAAIIQYQKSAAQNTISTKQSSSIEWEDTGSEHLEGCVLDEGLTVFDTWEQNVPTAASDEAMAPQEKQVVNEIVVFIRFADEGEDIYEQRGGYDYIMGMFDGAEPSLKTYVDEYSWGQVEANTYVWPKNSDGTPKCYVDEHPRSYYLKQTSSNPNGYPTSEKSSRRQNLLKNAVASMGSDFLEKMGIENEPYNLVFMVPDSGSWNDLLWSHKSYVTINGTRTVYNLITYETKKNIARTVTHEFMHSLGFTDMYRYYTDTSANPVYTWSIMGSTLANAGHPLVYEKDKYGKWLGESDAITTIGNSGHYELGPSTADPEENILAYKIPVEGVTDQYFIIEYRGSSSSGYDTALKSEGLIFYRVNTKKNGNGYGPPDEVYVLRGSEGVTKAYYDGTEGKTEFSGFQLYDDTTDLGISVYNIKKEDGHMSFDIEVPYVELKVSKEGPISIEESKEIVLSTDSSVGSANYTYRFGTMINGVEYELSGGYQSKNSIKVDFFSVLKSKTAGNHTLFVDVKNTTTGKVKRGTISNYEINGVKVSEIITDIASPQKAGVTIGLSAAVENEAVSKTNTYQFVIKKDGKEEVLVMDSSYTAKWTPKEGGIYTIQYTVADAYGLTGTKEIQYPIGTDTTAYVFYNKSSWNKAYIHYKIGSGTWTTAPGVQMTKSNVEGYSWIYLIELGGKTATAAFNNGNNTWDNNSEKNYTLTAGVNSIGGKSMKLSSVEISADSIERKQCKFTVSIKGGIAPYVCDYTIKRKADDQIVEQHTEQNLNTGTYEISSTADEIGEYVLSVTVKDSYGQTVSQEEAFALQTFHITDIKTSLTSPQLLGTEITLTEKRKNASVNGENVCGVWTIKNRTTGTTKEEIVYNSETLKWIPTELGEYEITVKTTDSAGETATYTIFYSIVEKIVNKATIYYTNSSWSTAYIHYKIDAGDWTNVPGVIMEANSEQSGYTWKYVMELGEETGATLCFNNGNNSWDSKNGADYTVGVGTYGIKNGTVVELTPVVTQTPITTAKPAETISPTPATTLQPTVTPTLAATLQPTISPTPSAAIEPTETPVFTPTISPTPIITIEPTQIVTVTPITTIAPPTTKVPTITLPVTTEMPVSTLTPAITKEPVNTFAPIITTTPMVTEVPISSKTPVATPTETGMVTLIPKPTEETIATVTPIPTKEGTVTIPPEKETLISDSDTKAEYKIILAGNEKAAEYIASISQETNIVVPDTINVDGVMYKVTKISNQAFKNNKTLKTITIGKYVTVIGNSAFRGCTSLQKVKKGANVQKIEDKAFYGCKKLTSVSMSAKLAQIGKYAFYKCTSLKKITIPSKVKNIGTKAFYDCKKLKTIIIKTKKLTEKNVGNKAWKGIYAKAAITVPNSKAKAYKKLLKSKGAGSKVKIKKL